ncbi:glycosyltransferase family 52 protein [Fusobacterium nucleatum]|uniref:glycosyltransferase family 52 n=1 Tax=Fusobacterium animalis TaxID=76859 RepID=UPI001C6EDFBD|nr:glycosyltransferase family 52 [Fusobacterium animalis]QYR63960.1 hypothetical protein JY398_02015 [Fusobacterium animalis]
MKNICHVGSYYSLLLYLLLPNKNVDNTFFFFGDLIEIKNLPKNYYIIKRKNLKFPLSFIYHDFILKFILDRVVKKNKLNTNIVYGQDHLLGSSYFLKYNFYLIEDGAGFYTTFEIDKKRYYDRYWINKILGRKKVQGLEKSVKKIYITRTSGIPSEIKGKTELINLKKLWNLKTEEERKDILNIIGVGSSDIEELKKAKNILLTQPISEDLVVTEEEKIEIYRKIINKYGEERLLIKPHPREKTDYKKIFTKATVIGKNFPFEIISLLDIEIRNLITLFSTSVFSMATETTNIVFYGTRVSQKLVDRFGDIRF